jgi:NAD(P)-dependent dehydrogenase (short-subunit alcohol dehydrogenase family)
MKAEYPFRIIPDEFKAKRVLVTGGTKGMGAAAVRRFQLSGAKVATTARSSSEKTASPLLFIQADLSMASGVRAVVDRIDAEWGGLDILVNNVGGTENKDGGFEQWSDDDWQAVLNLNLMAAVRLDRAFLPGMIARKSGAVIHISSVSHRLPSPDGTLAYAAAKGALRSYSKGLAKGVAPNGVRVNMISPGFIETPAAAQRIREIAQSQKISDQAARQAIMDLIGGIPVGRTGEPEEVAEMVAFLASERAGFVSGVDYAVDGGTIPTI